jgi:hypothetical protein
MDILKLSDKLRPPTVRQALAAGVACIALFGCGGVFGGQESSVGGDIESSCEFRRLDYLRVASRLCDTALYNCAPWEGFSPPLDDPENPLPVGYRQVGETVTFMISDELCRGIQDELN